MGLVEWIISGTYVLLRLCHDRKISIFSFFSQGTENAIQEAVVACFQSQRKVIEICEEDDSPVVSAAENFSLNETLSAFDVATLKLEEAVEHLMTLEGEEEVVGRVRRYDHLECCDSC